MILSNFITWFSPDKTKMISGFQRVYCFWSSQTVNWLQLISSLWPEGIRLTASRQRINTFRRVDEASVNYCYKYSLLHQRRPNCHVTSFVRWLRLSWCNYYGEHTQTHTVYCRQTVDILYKRIQNVKCHNQFIAQFHAKHLSRARCTSISRTRSSSMCTERHRCLQPVHAIRQAVNSRRSDLDREGPPTECATSIPRNDQSLCWLADRRCRLASCSWKHVEYLNT